VSHLDFDSAVLGARFCDGGHLVNGEDAVRLPASLPKPPAPKGRRDLLPATCEGWGRLIGAALGLGGFFLFAREAYRLFFT
jgi:hypothetical protein